MFSGRFFCHLVDIPNFFIYQFILYSNFDHRNDGSNFMSGGVPIEFSLSDVALILRIPNYWELVDIEATVSSYMFENFFRDHILGRQIIENLICPLASSDDDIDIVYFC